MTASRRIRTLGVAGGCGIMVLTAALVPEGAGALVQDLGLQAAIRAMPNLTIGSLQVDPSHRRVSLLRAGYSKNGLRVSAERIDVATSGGLWFLIAPAMSAQGATTSADNIRIEVEGDVITIPHLELRGASLASVLSALGSDDVRGPPLREALNRLSFESLAAPEVTLTHAGSASDGTDERISVRNVAISGLTGGKIGLFSLEGARFTEVHGSDTRTVAELGRVAVHAFDVALASAVASRARTDPNEALRPMLDSLSVDGISVTPKPGESLRVGSFEYAGLKARPFLMEPARAMDLAGKKDEERSEAERTQLYRYVADSLASFSVDRFELRAVHFEKQTGKDPGSFDLGDFRIDDLAGGKIRTVSADSFRLESPEVTFSFGRFALNGLDQSGPLDFLASSGGNMGVTPTGAQLARLWPKLSDVSLRDLSITAAGKDLQGNIDEGRKTLVTVPLVEARFARHEGDVAGDVTSRLEAIYDIVSPAPGSGLDQAKQNGFDHFDVTSDYALGWDEATGVARLGHVRLAAKDLAEITLGMALSGVTRGLWSGEETAISTAPQDVQFRALDATLTNAGLAEKALPLLAASSNTTVPALKAALAQQADEGIAEMLGAGPAAVQVKAAADAFIDNPKTFSVTVTARDGLSLKSIVEAKSPEEILNRLVITATANH